MKVLSNLSLYGTLGLNSVADANTDTDKFLVIDSNGIVKYRTGQELYNDIGAGGAAAYTSTLQHEVKAGVALTKGQAVYVTSADGTNMIVSKASNASEATSSKTLGLIAQDLSINGKGFVITEGLLSGLNTMAAGTEGDPVWLGTDGNLIYGLGAKPYAPAHLVFIGIVTRKNANNGEIFVKVQNGFELQELHNVQITSTPSDNTVLAYETSTSLYKMKSIPALLGYTPTTNARTLTINGTSYDLSADRSWSVGTHTGNLTTGYVPKATGATTLTDSLIYDNGSAIGINTNSPYESSAFKLDVNGGVIIKNTNGTAAQLILINSNPATGGNNGFVQLSAGGNTATAFGQWQTYYGMSVASGALRLQPAGGQVLIGTTTTSAFTTDINGTLRVSGQLTLGSTISNNTYVYTMPGASGTLALVSQIPSLSGYVQTSRTLTINGVSYDLSADRSWSIATGVSSIASGTGISVSTVSGVATITNTGLLSAASGTGISVSTLNQQITVTNTGLLSAASGTGISVSTANQQITVTNLGLLSAASGNGISVSTANQQITITNTGILSLISGTGISISTVNGAATITNSITNTNQLTNGAGYITGINSSMVISALGYTPYNSSNPNGYISSYTETDTLASVTARGASTSTAILINNSLAVNGGTVNTTTYTSSEARLADGSIHLMKTSAAGIFEAVRAINSDTTVGTTVRLVAAATSDPFNNTNGGKVFIDAVRTSTNMDLVFSLNDVAGAAPVERVRFFGSGAVTFSSNISVGGGSEVLGLIQMGASGRYGMGVSGAWTSVYGHNSGNGVRLGYYDGSTFYSRMSIPNGGAPLIDSNVILHAGNYNSYSPTLTGGGASGTWGINITGNASTATTATNSSQLNGISSTQIFNNMGLAHGTYTDFNSVGDFGVRYIQGNTNGPGTGAGQFYGFTLGLGSQYDFASYAMQIAMPRYGYNSSSDRYLSIRNKDGGTWTSWSKIFAGYADTAGSLSSMNISQFTNNSGYITSSSLSSYLPLSGGTMSGTIYFTDTSNGIYKSGGRFTVRSESTDNVANFASYGLYLPVMGQTAGLYVESPIEARGGLRIGSGASSGTINVGADTGVVGSRLVQRDANGYIYANHVNFSTSESENPTISSFITSNGDGWSRKSSLQHVRNQLGNYGGWITGYTETDTLATVVGRGNSTGGGRPITLDSGGGAILVRASTGGWSMGTYYQGSSGTTLAGFGAYGGNNSLTWSWIGPGYENPWITINSSQSTFNVPISNGNFYINGNGYGTSNADEWPHIYWLRNTGAGWDEGLIKGSSSRGFFGRAGWGIHMDQSRAFHFFSSGWESLFGVEGGTGNTRIKGTLNVGTGGSNNGSLLNITGGTHNQVNITNGSGWGLLLGYCNEGSVSGYHGPNSAALINVQDGPLHLGTGNTSRVTVLGNGNVTFNGSIGLAVTADVRLSVNGDAHVSNIVYLGGTAGSVGSWGTRTYGYGGDWTNNSRTVRFDNVGYGTNWSFTIDTGGNVQSSSSMRAPIFYDSNDTTYYLDPNSTSELRNLYLGAHDSGTSEFLFGENSSGWYGMRWYWDSGVNFYWYGRNAGTDTLIMNYTTNDNAYLKWHRSFHLNGSSVDYVGSLYFNNAGHIQPNSGSYGALQMTSTKNGWAGLYFSDTGATLMMNGNETGFYRQGYGWQWRWDNGVGYIHAAANGGGTAYAILHTGNYSGTLDGRYFFDYGFTEGYPGTNANTMPGNRSAFTYSNGAPYTGPIAHFGASGYGLQLNANYGDGTLLGYRVRNGDNATWGSWRRLVWEGGTWSMSITGNAATVGGRSVGNSAGNIGYFDSNGNLYVNNPESYGGEVRLGAAWGRGGVYASSTLSLSTSSSEIHFVFGNGVPIYVNSSGSIIGNGTINFSGKSHYLGASNSWDGVGFGSMTNLHFQGHAHFWMGAGNAYWYRGGIGNEHDLLITTMYGYDSTSYYRGITFAVENTGAGNSGYRLGRWQTYGSSWITARLQVDASLSVGYGARGTRAYDESQYPLNRGVWAHGRNEGGYGSDRVRDYLFSPTSNGGGPWGSFASLEVSSAYDGNNDIPALFRMHQWGSGAVEFWKPQGQVLYIRESPGGGGSWFNRLELQGVLTVTSTLNCNALNTGNVINIGYTYNNESVATSSFRGIEFHNPGGRDYYIGKPAGGWTQPLDIAFYTGIRYGANLSYGGHRFFNSTDWGTITASINNGDNNFRGYYDIIAYASDRRLKHNVKPIENALSKVTSLVGMTYQWNNVGSQHGWSPDTQVREAGVFAQDVQAVLPEAVKLAPFDDEMGVSKSGENFLTVKYEKIVPLLIEAIKEQQIQIEDLKSELNALTK